MRKVEVSKTRTKMKLIQISNFLLAKLSKASKLRTATLTRAAQQVDQASGFATSLSVTPAQGEFRYQRLGHMIHLLTEILLRF